MWKGKAFNKLDFIHTMSNETIWYGKQIYTNIKENAKEKKKDK